MFSAQSVLLQNDSASMIRVHAGGAPVTVREALGHLQDNVDFRRFLTATLQAAPFASYRLETPALTSDTADRAFEFVLVKDPSLARRADSSAFTEHFSAATELIVGFANLGRDAFMIVPVDPGQDADYSHLAAFLRCAPVKQIDALWQRVGLATELRLTDSPIWLNCAGGGIPWLHVRLDTRPKYYTFAPYKMLPE